jgi:SP family myo-inositol transporter-like MFS transporter 13
MGASETEKCDTFHVEASSENNNQDDLDSIESTQSGKFAWLVSVVASVGGLLFGKRQL